MIEAVIYVVQQWRSLANDGLWVNVMRTDGMPLMFLSQGNGWKAILNLQAEHKGSRFRLVKVLE